MKRLIGCAYHYFSKPVVGIGKIEVIRFAYSWFSGSFKCPPEVEVFRQRNRFKHLMFGRFDKKIVVYGEACAHFLFKKRDYKFIFVEYLLVFNTCAYTALLYRNLELIANANYHATFGCSIEFGDCQCRYFGSCGKLPGLFKGVLAG